MPRRISEERTRKEWKAPPFVGGVDPQLETAGWYLHDHSKVKIEIPVDGYDAEPWNGVTDYCRFRSQKTGKMKTNEMVIFDKTSDLGANKNANYHDSTQIPDHYSKRN